MKLTFPHMGNAYIAVRVLLDTLGIDYYMPPVGSRSSLEKGIANAPEFMCLPFKTVLGDFIDGLDHGADTILFGGGCGQCRQSYYGGLQQEILHSLGYQFDYIHLDLHNLSYHEIFNKFGPFIENKNKSLIVKAVTDAVWTVFESDSVYSIAAKTRCREVNKGETDRIVKHFEHRVQTEHGFHNIKDAILEAKRKVKAVKTDNDFNPVKVLLIGEIFLSSDMFTNLEIERKLGNLGAEVTNTMSVGTWIRNHFIKTIVPVKTKEKSVTAAYDYIHTDDIGGHGIQTIGNAVIGSKKGYDGIIQIYPFTCMPEIIAQCAFSDIEQKYGVPIMTLILDEMTGEAGYITRLEAFTDMLAMKRDHKNEKDNATPKVQKVG